MFLKNQTITLPKLPSLPKSNIWIFLSKPLCVHLPHSAHHHHSHFTLLKPYCSSPPPHLSVPPLPTSSWSLNHWKTSPLHQPSPALPSTSPPLTSFRSLIKILLLCFVNLPHIHCHSSHLLINLAPFLFIIPSRLLPWTTQHTQPEISHPMQFHAAVMGTP